ncbi:MAG TPA: P-loop NTPase [Burkholderiales bacterium]|nr:P-loop NTPase [Burkholderiales bacterium]
MRTQTTLVINPKGGSGKTTVATNLASYFAANKVATTLMDYDPQGSSLNWLRQRPVHLPRIHGANAAPAKPGRMRSLDMRVPEDTHQLVIDAPAGASGLLLQEMLGRTHCILIPVAPSSIDIHATANFIRDLLLAGRIRVNNIRLAVVANRVKKSVPVYQPLERFLNSLNLPLLARLSDSDVYVSAAESGMGVFEMDFAASAAERQQFMPVAEWVETPKLIVDPKTPSLPLFHPAISLPGRSGLRVVTKGFPAS